MNPLTLRKSPIDDWWVIEHADGSGVSNASVEGTLLEMKQLASAIKQGCFKSFKRCAVSSPNSKGDVNFWSPRNSQGTRGDRFPQEEALALAAIIEETKHNQ